ALALPDGATYSLTGTSGQLLAGTALEENSGNNLVRVLARDGLLFLEGATSGSAFLSIEAPRQAPQRFKLQISPAPAETLPGATAPAAGKSTPAATPAPAKGPVQLITKPKAKPKSPKVSIVPTGAT